MEILGAEPIVVDVGETTIAASVGGSGTAVLLLHGYPQSRAMWHRIAPLLAQHHTVVAADLRGYGDSGKPAGEIYDKRSMARDQFALMGHLGFESFAVVGHDRGARVAHRMALDRPGAISALAVLDIVPTLHMFENVDRAMAASYFHWFFLAQPDMPERLITASPAEWLASRFRARSLRADAIDPRAAAEYARCFDAETIAASCADYRAAATIDLEHDRADRDAGRLVNVPLLALWGAGSYVGRNFDVIDVWKRYGSAVEGRPIEADHYLAEEVPEQSAEALLAFLGEHT